MVIFYEKPDSVVQRDHINMLKSLELTLGKLWAKSRVQTFSGSLLVIMANNESVVFINVWKIDDRRNRTVKPSLSKRSFTVRRKYFAHFHTFLRRHALNFHIYKPFTSTKCRIWMARRYSWLLVQLFYNINFEFVQARCWIMRGLVVISKPFLSN